MSARAYLYSYGRKRHIAANPSQRTMGSLAHCGGWFLTDGSKLHDLTVWHGAEKAEQQMAKLRQLPVCKACEKSAPPADDSSLASAVEALLTRADELAPPGVERMYSDDAVDLVSEMAAALRTVTSELAITRVALADARRERDELAATTAGRDTATARKENPR